MTNRGSIPKAGLFSSRKELRDVKDGTPQPFLMRFASPVLQDGHPRRHPETIITHVERETTDDR